jgi:hypothetical protein
MVETGPSIQAAFNRIGRSPGATAGILKFTWYVFTVPGIPIAWNVVCERSVHCEGNRQIHDELAQGERLFQVNIGEVLPPGTVIATACQPLANSSLDREVAVAGR